MITCPVIRILLDYLPGNLIKFVDSTNQIIDSEWTNSNKLRLTNDSTFIFVSGLGGSPIFSQIYNEWPVNYTETQNALHGALFCKFNAGGQENKAYCYFKNIEVYKSDNEAFFIFSIFPKYEINNFLLFGPIPGISSKIEFREVFALFFL